MRNNAIALTRFLGDVRAEAWARLDSNRMKHEEVRVMLPAVQATDPDEIVLWTGTECEGLLAPRTLPWERFGL